MEESKILNCVVQKERGLKLYDLCIANVPIWRIVRYHTRLFFINKQVGYQAGTSTSIVGKPSLKLCSGFWKHIGKQRLNLFFPFNRLVETDGFFLDKFIDPVIEESDLKDDNYIIVDPPNYVGQYERLHRDHTISNEGRTILSQVLKFYFKFITPIRYGKIIKELFSRVQSTFELPDSFVYLFYSKIAIFLARYYYYKLWFKILRPVHVFIVYREGYFPQIAVCKEYGIKIAEFQHGITLDDTVSFAGEYDPRIDPDYFLIFGDYWKGPQFGMPLDRIVNIGWAYSKFLQKTVVQNAEKHVNEVLVISSPEISDSVLDALKVLSEAQGDFSFDIRLHPCESYNDAQNLKLQSISKAQVVNNKTDSALVLPTYKYVVGENSSVIYEALSVGCKVGMLNLCGLRPAIDLPGIKENFFVINDAKDFEQFLSEDKSLSVPKAGFYSDFDSEAFMNFLKEKM